MTHKYIHTRHTHTHTPNLPDHVINVFCSKVEALDSGMAGLEGTGGGCAEGGVMEMSNTWGNIASGAEGAVC